MYISVIFHHTYSLVSIDKTLFLPCKEDSCELLSGSIVLSLGKTKKFNLKEYHNLHIFFLIFNQSWTLADVSS